MNELEPLYKVSEIAKYLRCSRASVYRLFDAGSLESIKSGGTRLVTHTQMVQYIQRRKAALAVSQSESS